MGTDGYDEANGCLLEFWESAQKRFINIYFILHFVCQENQSIAEDKENLQQNHNMKIRNKP